MALGTNPNLPRHHRRRHARASDPLRMAGMITALILIPLFGAFAVCVWPHTNARPIVLIFNAITATLVFMLWRNFDATAPGLQMVERHVWIPAIGAEYLVGIDGLSLLLVLLTSIIIPFAFLAQRASRGFYVLMFLMELALFGTV